MPTDEQYLGLALEEAEKAATKGEVPVGAIIILDGIVIAKAHNLKEKNKDCLAHAEMLAIKQAQKAMNDWRLSDCVMYSTLEPCVMCAGAILHSRLKRIVFSAKDLKWGGMGSKVSLHKEGLFNHNLDVSYVPDLRASTLLSHFFQSLRIKKDKKL
jgi:tRNA(adenine34) deaminase